MKNADKKENSQHDKIKQTINILTTKQRQYKGKKKRMSVYYLLGIRMCVVVTNTNNYVNVSVLFEHGCL